MRTASDRSRGSKTAEQPDLPASGAAANDPAEDEHSGAPPAVGLHPNDVTSLAADLLAARRALLQAAALLPEERWNERPTPTYSPSGWHLGHVAEVQARWLLGETQDALFDPARTPKQERAELPDPPELHRRLESVLERTLAAVQSGNLPRRQGLPADFLVHHVVQHELQHAEHLRVIAALCEGRLHRPAAGTHAKTARPTRRVEIAGGEVAIGSADASRAYDNERPRHRVRLAPFWIDAAPATIGEFEEFVRCGGYRDARLWSPDGWRWRFDNGIEAPLGWTSGRHPDGALDHPVSCVSWFEADAYARWRGARLPTEAEWEATRATLGDRLPPGNFDARHSGTVPVGAYGAAGGLSDLVGQVWEWTASWFGPYPGFCAYPYEGYSTPWFGTHRSLRGGCWATSAPLCRTTFRNWYEPGFREIPAGVRCAGGAG